MDSHVLKTCGYSLIELSIAMGVIAVLTAAVMPVAVRSIEIKAGEKAITEIGIIQKAAQKYYNDHSVWPSNLVQLQAQGYLSPAWSLNNPWNLPYQTQFSEKIMTVSTQVPGNLTGMLKARLPQSSVTAQVVSSVLSADESNIISPGVIVAWSGTIHDIPKGWSLCDGTNGTPDLRDKFIVGAREDNSGVPMSNILGYLSSFGGKATHDHGGVTGGHHLTIAEMPAHHHGYNETPWLGARYDGHSSPVMTGQRSSQTSDTGGDQPHSHPISADYNVPPFYALAFIMKI